MNPKAGTSAEVDFTITHNGLCIPIEVKSGTNAHLKSLHSFMNVAPHSIAIRIWAKPFRKDSVTTSQGKTFTLLSVPFYYISQIKRIIDSATEA